MENKKERERMRKKGRKPWRKRKMREEKRGCRGGERTKEGQEGERRRKK
jgi:hypothetical protein